MAAPTNKSTISVNGPIIVGAGPSGLAVSACLSLNGVPSLILEKTNCLASLWEERSYDRLKLHLPKKYCHLPHLLFPKEFPQYPTRKQFISYLNLYASFFSIKPNFLQTVHLAEFNHSSGLWEVTTQDSFYSSPWLIVAAGENADPVIPYYENFKGRMVHSSMYKSGAEFENQKVLVIGCGNSGMEVSYDLCKHKAVPHMVVRSNVHVLPKEVFGFSIFGIIVTLIKLMPVKMLDKILLILAKLTLGDTQRIGLPRPKLGPIEYKNTCGKTPVLDPGAVSEIRSGNIKVMKGIRRITEDGAEFTDGREMRFDSIVFATGYKSNVSSWLKGSDFFTARGIPKLRFPNNWKGESGLYTVGFSGKGLVGSSIDAIKVAKDITPKWNSVTY